jgi:Reverse transcriptase (RNA-dependent DNA polymerase)
MRAIESNKEALRKQYQMTDLSELSWILGLHVTHNHLVGEISLSQEKFCEDILKRFNMLDACPISTPTLANEHLVKLSSPEVDPKKYQRMVGALMYAMLRTQPDLAYTVAMLG